MSAVENKIYIGNLTTPTYEFDNDTIFGVSISQSVSLVGQELCIDTMTVEVADSWENVHSVVHFRTADTKEIRTFGGPVFVADISARPTLSGIVTLAYGTPVWYYKGAELVGRFYVNTTERTAGNKYKIDCISAIGLLDKMYHKGGIYSQSTFKDVVDAILLGENGQAVIDYEFDDDVASLTVGGYLPHDTKRNNLYQIMFAYGVNIKKNPNGAIRFTFIYPIPNGQTPEESVTPQNTFAEGSVSYDKPYSKITVTEHTYTYISTEAAVTLYDNTTGEGVTNLQVWYSQAPVKVPVTASAGLTIISQNENGAVVSGSGTLTGIPHVHTKKDVEMVNEDAEDEKLASVSDCTMVNVTNSQNLLDRLYAYYCPQFFIETVNGSIVYNGEKCGKAYGITTCFDEDRTVFLTKADITTSSFNKASCEFRAGYTPAGQSGLYQRYLILDKKTFLEDGGVFTVPSVVFEEEIPSIRVVMIGGGQGGQSGYPGVNGQDATGYANADVGKDMSEVFHGAEGGDGGAGGNGGAAGRVRTVTIPNPAATYNYTIGTGGDGGAKVGFRPDTLEELRAALHMEEPEREYTDAQINQMIAFQQTLTNWRGVVNDGDFGTATTFGTHSSAETGSYVPSGGVYNPLSDKYYALTGTQGQAGGKGGSRKLEHSDGTFEWLTDGENVEYNGTVYIGGTTGLPLNKADDLPEAYFIAYGGNGAGAAVGISRTARQIMDGVTATEYDWDITEDGGD